VKDFQLLIQKIPIAMQKIVQIILFTLIISNIDVKTIHGQVVPPAQVITYLQQKINIFYIGQPNAIHTQLFRINPILTSSISMNTDGIIFGRGGNNRMSTSALLLLSLFKDRTMGGDGKFQDWVYNLLKIKDKPVNLYFYNDQMAALNPGVVNSLWLDTIQIDNGLRVWPGTWRGAEGSAGDINLGDYFFQNRLNYYQASLIEMITSAEINSYRAFHISGIFSFEHAGFANRKFYSSAAVMDTRFLTDQGICNGLVNTYDTAYQRTLYRWFARPSMTLLRQPPEANSTMLMPNEAQTNWLLKNRIYNDVGRLMTTIPQFSARANTIYGWFNFSTVDSRTESAMVYKFRNEITQGLIYNYCLQKLGFQRFLNSLIFNNNRYVSTDPDHKLAVLLENICRIEMGTQTLEQLRSNPPANKSYLAPIALVHLLTGKSANFTYQQFSTFVGDGFSEEIFNLYSPGVQTSIRAINLTSDNPDAWYAIRDQIDTILRS
jgi:hypothetical protein